MNILNIYIPQTYDPKTMVQGIINLILTLIILISAMIILKDAIPGWFRAFRAPIPVLVED